MYNMALKGCNAKLELLLCLQDCCLVMSGVTAKWSNTTEDNTLTDVSFSVKAGELLAIVGPVGAGKVFF